MVEHVIATIGSHSALQILKGARDEGFKTLVICKRGQEKPYQMFPVADEILLVDDYKDFFEVEPTLKKKNAIIIPHASFIAYMGTPMVEKISVPYFGNKHVLHWEADRNLQRQWLTDAGLKVPRIYNNPKDIDRSVIVKLHGAKGGKGYFIANSEEDFKKKFAAHNHTEDYVIQEYILGVPIYVHYFYSPLTQELEIMSFDRRFESNVDSLGRISARDQIALDNVDPSYVIVGNLPLVVRESLLPHFIDIGEKVVAKSKELMGAGLFGPFCLEGIVTPDLEYFVFEISARIVAGTNPFIEGSPYSALRYKEPMSTGRRIAREIKNAIKNNQLHKIVT